MRLSSVVSLALTCTLAFALGVALHRVQRGGGDGETGALDADTTTDANPAALPPGILWPDPKPVASFTLQDHLDREFGLQQLLGRWSFLFFGYTHCPDICPITLGLMSGSWATLQDQHPDRETQMIFVTLDPSRDDHQTLAEYLDHFNREFIGLGGPLPAVLDFARQLGIPYSYRNVEGSEDYHVDHPGSLFLLDEQARLVGVFHPPHQPEEILARFAAIVHFLDTHGTQQAAPVQFSDAWINTPPPRARAAAGYMTIHNPSSEELRLVAVHSDNFETVELHESVQDANYMMQMRQLSSLTIPAGGERRLSPGGYHLMLKGPRRPLQTGDAVRMDLHFADGGRATLSVPVREQVLVHDHNHAGH